MATWPLLYRVELTPPLSSAESAVIELMAGAVVCGCAIVLEVRIGFYEHIEGSGCIWIVPTGTAWLLREWCERCEWMERLMCTRNERANKPNNNRTVCVRNRWENSSHAQTADGGQAVHENNKTI